MNILSQKQLEGYEKILKLDQVNISQIPRTSITRSARGSAAWPIRPDSREQPTRFPKARKHRLARKVQKKSDRSHVVL